jgi:hypothetical protein
MHNRPREKASETSFVEILHWEAGDKIFGELLGTTGRYGSISSSPIRLLTQ